MVQDGWVGLFYIPALKFYILNGRYGDDGASQEWVTMTAGDNGQGMGGPTVWVLLGDKLGDNGQVEVIVDALDWPVEHKNLVFKPEYCQGKPPFKASLYHLETESSSPLAAPWPDLILTIGRRPSMAALWVREQSGGHTRVVIVGRPKRHLNEFALVVATPQYSLPDHPNVLRLDLPLMRPDRERVRSAAEAWAPRLQAMSRPLTAVLVGGITKPFSLDAATAHDLATRAAACSDGGSVYLSTSRRTPADVVQHLQAALPEGGRSYVWGRDAADDNPYQALLGSADRFIVTGDSISMMVEVIAMGKPLAIYPLPQRGGMMLRLRQGLAASKHLAWAQRRGLLGFARDLTAIHRLLYRRGLAVPLGELFPAPRDGGVPEEAERVAERIRALFDGERASLLRR